ncbi:MAG: peptidoglycan DD-metalloendopeptidase family protein [Magnetococcales bacterium]|nr:peptidoglycan DD-metalloendopeptidase family protein [Magnetococcales bacterium]
MTGSLLIAGLIAGGLVLNPELVTAESSPLGSSSEYANMIKRKRQRLQQNDHVSPYYQQYAALSSDLYSGESLQPLGPAEGIREVITRVRRNDTLSGLLERHRVALKSALAIARASKPVFNLSRHLKPGEPIKLGFTGSRTLVSVAYPVGSQRTLLVKSDKDGRFSAQILRTPFASYSLTDEPKHTSPSRSVQQVAQAPVAKAPQVAAVSTTPAPRPVAAPKRRDSAFSNGVNPHNLLASASRTLQVTVRSGDNLTALLGRHNVPNSTAMDVARSAKPTFDLARNLRPGQEINLSFANGALIGLNYPISDAKMFWLTRASDKDGFRPTIEKKSFDVQLKTVSAEVNGALITSAAKAGLSQNMALQLAKLFEFDVDFARDLRSGDAFKVVFEELYYKGNKESNGDIIAAEFINQGHTYRVFRYTDPKGQSGFYHENGSNIRKMFIRAPVSFTRISSRFSKRRKHPVYGFHRAHKGVDYAAPNGTPVRASGAGTVVFRARKGGFGNLVLVKHNSKYTTAYAHMSRFAKSARKGDRVKQGQVIGYVGATGAATGPHLHYEVRVYGKQVDPLKVQMASANPVPKKYMSDFKNKTRKLVAMMKQGRSMVALAK